MIDREQLLADLKPLVGRLVDDLRERTEADEETATRLRGEHSQARDAGRTDRSYEEWREDRLHEDAAAWVLAAVFVRFCEDNGLASPPLLSGPGNNRQIARDHRQQFFAENRTAGDRAWLEHVFTRYRYQKGTSELFGDRSAIWDLAPSDDGARALLEAFWALDEDTGELVHDFTDPEWDTRFLGDLYQDLSERAKDKYALLQTPRFVESFILDYTLDPAIEEFGLAEVRMIDPTCGSGHFLLGAFERLLAGWREREPRTGASVLVQRVLERVNGVDANPYAVAIARFRLLITALKAVGVGRLEDAPDFRFRVATADSLIHGTRPTELFAPSRVDERLKQFRYAYEDSELADKLLEHGQYHAVVGNPPYITVKDGGLNHAYRSLYDSCHRQYSLVVPFTERFFDLATSESEGAGFVGMIAANSFMKREFGKKLIEERLRKYDLTHVIDTSGAYIPGHGTPTVVLFGRDQGPASETVRAVLGIRGEPGRPAEAARGQVWSSILDLVGKPGSENEFVSVLDLERDNFHEHPWSLQGGAAPEVHRALEQNATERLSGRIADLGFGAVTREDDVFRIGRGPSLRQGVSPKHVGPLVAGDEVRDWRIQEPDHALWPYAPSLEAESDDGLLRLLWHWRHQLSLRPAYGKTQLERGLQWWEYSMFFSHRFRVPLSITFAFVATHNHFVLDRGGKVFKQSAPVIKLREGANEEEHLELLGLLNSSAACFWMKQVFHNKGAGGGTRVASGHSAMGDEAWESHFEFDGTKVKQFPIPARVPVDRARAMDQVAGELSAALPASLREQGVPRPEVLDKAKVEVGRLRGRMVALQEEVDWECYHHYGLIEKDLTLPVEQLPDVNRGERAFEIVLARRQARGEVETSWFERQGSAPTTEIPARWPEPYKELVERRIALIESDRKLGLLERPEYKRRWNWNEWENLEQEALREWLLDRLEARQHWAEPRVRTVAQLTDLVRGDADFGQMAERYAGRRDVDLTKLVASLVDDDQVPFLAAWRYTESGMRTRVAWEEVWDLQREEDRLDECTELPADHPENLTPGQAQKEKDKLEIPVPPKYKKSDFRSNTCWRLRGKLDVPKERFISYPGTQMGSDTTAVIGWAGWDHLQQAQALAAHYTARRDGAETDELMGLLAGLVELEAWLHQWHHDYDPTYGQRLDEFFTAFIDSEIRGLGLTRQDLAEWTPRAKSANRRTRDG